MWCERVKHLSGQETFQAFFYKGSKANNITHSGHNTVHESILIPADRSPRPRLFRASPVYAGQASANPILVWVPASYFSGQENSRMPYNTVNNNLEHKTEYTGLSDAAMS